MKTLQLALPPRFSITLVVLAMVIWGIQHPAEASAQTLERVAAQESADGKVEPWILPVKTPVDLRANYLAPAHKYSAGHRGIDFAVRPKSVILAPASGLISYAGLVAFKPTVAIKHASNFVSSFEPVCTVLLVGAQVKKGQVIGQACGSVRYKSHCAPVLCLHYGLRHNDEYLSALGVSGALPPSHTVSFA